MQHAQSLSNAVTAQDEKHLFLYLVLKQLLTVAICQTHIENIVLYHD